MQVEGFLKEQALVLRKRGSGRERFVSLNEVELGWRKVEKSFVRVVFGLWENKLRENEVTVEAIWVVGKET